MELLSDRECKLILALAECNMSISAAANSLEVEDKDIVYRQLEKIYIRTGLNPRKFYDLYKLTESARHQIGMF